MKFITQAAKVLQEQKKSKRRLAVFLCLAALVALGTVTALRMYGQAMSHKEKRLICQAEAHQHTDDCYDGDKLVCGQADYLVHTHNDDCYGADGSLVCHLAEIAVHTHTDECYTEEEVLVCTEEEQAHQHTDDCYTPERGDLQCQTEEHAHDEGCFDSETGELVCQLEEHQHDDNCYVWNEVLTCTAGGHQHSADCYIKEQGGLQCQIEEHTHDDACYDENGALICQMEEHTHEDTCYAWEDVLICQLEEGPAGHIHTDACYEKRKVPTCGQLELHTHGGSCYDENGELICELLELKEHTHQEECFETVELTDEEVAVKLEQEKTEDAFRGEDPGSVSGDAVESVSEDAVEEEPAIIKAFENEKYIVTASYHKDAEIPEDAELRAELITSEMDGAHYAEREAEIRKALEDESLSMNALLKIGFYEEENEIEPKSDVTVTVQFLDEDGLVEESPIAVIHFGEDGNQVLNGGRAKDQSTTFKTNDFSEFGIVEGYDVEKAEKSEGPVQPEETAVSEKTEAESIPVNQTYEYESEVYNITFHIKGDAILAEDTEDKSDAARVISFGDEDTFVDTQHDTVVSENGDNADTASENALSGNETSENEDNADGDISDNGLSESQQDKAAGMTESETEGDEEAGEVSNEGTEDLEVSGDAGADLWESDDLADLEKEDSAADSDFEFKIEPLPKDSESHMAAQEYMEEEADKLSAQSQQLMLQTISYSLMYKGKELDLSDCEIEAEITPAETLLEEAKDKIGDKEGETSVAFTVMGISQDNEVSEVDTISLENKKAIRPLQFSMPSAMRMLSAGANARANVDPRYKVEYYAYVKVPVTTTDDPTKNPALELINTDNGANGTGGRLPTNNATKVGKTTIENDGVIRLKMNEDTLVKGSTYTIKYESKLMKIFESEEFNFMNYPQLKYVNKFKYKVKVDATKPEEPELNPDPHYDTKEIWVDSAGSSNGNDNWDGWKKLSYTKEGDLEITNNAGQADDKHILIQELENGKKPVIRFVCNYNTKDKNGEEGFTDPVDFYDYDISDGNIYASESDAKKKTNPLIDRNTSQRPIFMNVAQEGINQEAYGITIGQYDTQSGARFGFGNAMNAAGIVWDRCKLNGYQINQANISDGKGGTAAKEQRVYGMCSFGLVQNSLINGYPAFSQGLQGPDLFSQKVERGKKRVTGYAMDFERAGDTYVLKSVYNSEAVGKERSIDNLDEFTYTNDQYTFKTPIYSNSFWPMDFSKTYNETGHDYKFGGGLKDINAAGVKGTISLEEYRSDEGVDHNSFFGMTFAVNFELTRDYCGLLDYYFFGDDDMWVYLVKKNKDGSEAWSKLVCDIGGVHSSVGEYVNLWNWIEKGEVGKDGREGQYALKFFYTERGASGSTCWMQYTLPSASIQPVDQSEDQDQLTVKKTVENLSNPKEEFEFKITLHAGTGNRYPYVIKDENGAQIGSGNITDGVEKAIKLQHNQQVTIMHLPKGIRYTVVETTPREEAFEKTEYKINNGQLNSGYKAEGSLDEDQEDIVKYINTAREYELPETGGPGAMVYTIAGVLFTLLGAGFMYRRRLGKGGI